jgi:hypothetical protein
MTEADEAMYVEKRAHHASRTFQETAPRRDGAGTERAAEG